MGQDLIIAVLFLAALVYVGYMIYKSFQPASCSPGCNSCGINFSKIEKELKKKEAKM